MIKAILWDNDGVLVDTERLYYEATRRIMAGAGVDLTQEQFVEFFMVQNIGVWHLAVERGIPAESVPTMKRERNAVYSRLLSESNLLIDGVEETVRALHGRYTLGIVTSSRREHFDIIHRSTGLLRYFDFVLSAEDCARHKPDPQPYQLAVERSGFPANQCLAVEDSERGLRSALGAGVRCVVVPNGMTEKANFEGAYRVLACVQDLLSVL
jgi:HAD superfamily hydrolase (TIGR01509 family)